MMYILTKKILFTSFAVLLFLNPALAFDNKGYNNNLQIINEEGDEILGNFKVKIADEKSSQEKGLMFVDDLPKDHGLLFDFNEDKVVYMWMKNTLISLDMIFIDNNNNIVNIVSSTVPLSLNTVSSSREVRKVLEVVGGSSKILGIEVGDKIKLLK